MNRWPERLSYFLELHNVQHGEKDPVDGGTPTLMEVPVVPMRDRVSGVIMLRIVAVHS